jgi:hypothetical protein
MQSTQHHLQKIIEILQALPIQDEDTKETIMQLEEYVIEFHTETTDHFLKLYFIYTLLTNVSLSYRKEVKEYAMILLADLKGGLDDILEYGHSFQEE